MVFDSLDALAGGSLAKANAAAYFHAHGLRRDQDRTVANRRDRKSRRRPRVTLASLRRLRAARVLGLGLLTCAACRSHAPNADAAAPASATRAASPPGSKADAESARLPRGECPLSIVPGRALGPVRLGASLDSLGAIGVPLEPVSSEGPTAFVDAGPMRVRACGGTIVEAWIDDVRRAPDCMNVGDRRVDRAMTFEAFTGLFRGCRELPPRTGGSFTECEDGGVRIGRGMGDVIQLRVTRAGSDIDEACADVLDDGGAVALSPAELARLLQKTLDIAPLAPFWHPDKPNRDPLRVVRRTAIAGDPALSMFGSKVEWIDRAGATSGGKPYFEFTRVQSTARRVLVEFRYPVEGVTGSVTFQKRGDDWLMADAHVAEH
jgi:hypothetical protein